MDYSRIKAGDRVRVGTNPQNYNIIKVRRVTSKYIVLDYGTLGWRFRKSDGQPSRHKGRVGQRIVGLASPAQGEAWEEQNAAYAASEDIRKRREAAVAVKLETLQALLPKGITIERINDLHLQSTPFVIHRLSEAQVRRIAKVLEHDRIANIFSK